MLKEHAAIFRRLKMAVDAFLVAVAFCVAYYIRNASGESLWPLRDYVWIIPVQIGLWVSTMYVFNMYASFRLKGIPHIALTIIKSTLSSVFLFGSIIYLFKLVHVSRALVLLSFILSAILIFFEKIVVLYLFRHLRRSGFNFRYILMVGTNPRAKRFIHQINTHREFGLNIHGIIDDDPKKIGTKIEGHEVIGTLKDIPELLRNYPIDQIFFIVPHTWIKKIEEAVMYCEIVGVRVSIAVDHFNLKIAKARVSEFLGVPMIRFETTPDRAWDLLIKRLIDVIFSLITLVILSPILFTVAVLVKITSPGPVFFVQERSGLNGRRFRLYKFRTMCADAEEKLAELKEYNEMQGPVFKMENDPRLTPIGKWLRKSSLDELPQLWNVLRGHMSLVGPRPPIPSEVTQYDHWQRRRLSMRPGLTCLWQIRGRNKIISFEEWMQMDLEYIDNWSLNIDLKIILQTIPVVLFGVGAK